MKSFVYCLKKIKTEEQRMKKDTRMSKKAMIRYGFVEEEFRKL